MKKWFQSILACLTAVSLAACGSASTSASSSAEASSASNVKDGTYTASAEGFGGQDVTVTITVEGGKITNTVVDASTQSADYGQKAADTLAQEITDGQTWDIDVASGATMTRNGASEAAKDAMSQAGFDVDNLAKASAASGEDETAECDVLVIGVGASGSVAALKAAESGAKVIGVEATDHIGGMGNAAQGMFAVGSVEQKDRYGEDGETTDEEYWYNHFQESNDDLGNAKLIRTFISEAKNTVSYMLNHGVGFFLAKTAQQIAHFDTEVVYHRWNNADPFTYIGNALDENGVDIRYNTTANSLTTDADGNVTGAVCTKADGGTLTITAKSTIVSTGSFANNPDLMKEVLGEEVYNNAMVMAGAELPGLEMMWNVGAAKGDLLTMNHGVVTMNADEKVSELTLNTPILWVNREGKRFMNEDLLKDTVHFSSAVVAQGGVAYTIVDQATVDHWTDMSQENTGTWIHYWDQHGIVDENGEPTIYHAPMDIDTWNAGFDALTAAGEGGVFDTIEEAAAFIGCDADDLQETIDNYNTYVENGYDEEFFKDKEDLVYSVKEGPYYVTKGHSGVLGALSGVNTNELLEVLRDDQSVIGNLYATGNNVSGISHGAYQDVEGVGLGFSLTSGRLAGAHAAENAGYTPTLDTTELTELGQKTMEEATARGMQGTTKHE